MSKISSRPAIRPFQPKELGPKSWGVELLVAETDRYTGKVLRMRAGAEGPLQYHERKDETMYLLHGWAWIEHDPGDGLVRDDICQGQAIHVPPGAVHRVGAYEDCIFFEASTPARDDRVNVEHEYPEGVVSSG